MQHVPVIIVSGGPDQHVAWRGDRLPENGDALLARVTGW